MSTAPRALRTVRMDEGYPPTPPDRPERLDCRLTGDYLVTYYRSVATDDDLVFKALADPTRRFLLDLLFTRDGRTLDGARVGGWR